MKKHWKKLASISANRTGQAIVLMSLARCCTMDGESKEKVMDKETALHEIDKLEDAICFEQYLIDIAIYKTEQKIRSYRDRIDELRKIAES